MHDDPNIDDHLCGMEAQEIMHFTSDYLLRMITSGQINLNKLAREELRDRRRREAEKQIAAMARRQP